MGDAITPNRERRRGKEMDEEGKGTRMSVASGGEGPPPLGRRLLVGGPDPGFAFR